MENLLGSPYEGYLPDQLLKHLSAPELSDTVMNYTLPPIEVVQTRPKKKESFASKPKDARIPARIASALIPYPECLREAISSNNYKRLDHIHGHHTSQLQLLGQVVEAMTREGKIPTNSCKFGIDDLKPFARQSYSRREQLISMAANSFARRATKHDISVAAMADIPFNALTSNSSKYTPFIIMIQRLRTHIAKTSQYISFKPTEVMNAPEEAMYTMYSNGVYHYRSTHPTHNFHILACGGHFRIYHADLGYWFAGPSTYLDYIFSIADILNNLDILKACPEYQWAIPTFNLMIDFAEHEGHHKDQVEFMKGLEGLFLTMSDYDVGHAMNWKPILETMRGLWELDMIISEEDYHFSLSLALMNGQPLRPPRNSFLCKFITVARTLTRTQCQEISALHKLIFYAEVNAEAGVKKFLKRVHTPRKVDGRAIKNMTRLAKQLFVLAYRARHKTLPNMVGPVPKVKLLELYSRSHDNKKIEELPLNWWDEIRIYNCMDNTMTDDPLEFAKDKGALKGQISYGPGDSRKELLQVIERKSYHLKDFFKGRTIAPLPKKVQALRQLADPKKLTDPARLIEKEREQKYEARLFANAELENKHSLSLVAAKMKKALSYFDEQLMTPTDKKRKSIIHEAARELGSPDNYSLLLDIEGHNQSMQHSNTSELAEFIGNLFGEDDWGDLPHYFSQLNVYHYDEYTDDVIHSTGQLGGIEGWLNPLWTLHTTLMMKLLRIMTDLIIKTIMVYSDDVNAIVAIPQASEQMVQSVFNKIMQHCSRFGMTVKYSQTTLSKHRITMLRQHYADGFRADSTLKRLLSVSAGNNPVIVADELEVSGICSSASSALELSNHSDACSYLKNYKLGLLLIRLPNMILSHPENDSMISTEELPKGLSNILYYIKEDAVQLNIHQDPAIFTAACNDIAEYLKRNPKNLNQKMLKTVLAGVYGVGVAEERGFDRADRLLYLQIYDDFLNDLLFFWTYLPTGLGGLGASLHINLFLSGHSVGMSKSLHYLCCWIRDHACQKSFFWRYLSTVLSVDMANPRNTEEARLASSNWPNDRGITSVSNSAQSAIKSMVRHRTRNEEVKKLFELSEDMNLLAAELVNLFRENFHSRVVQFYYENTAVHFVDLLLNKVETSSGLLTYVKDLNRLRNSLSSRVIKNIRSASKTHRTYFFMLDSSSDIIECLLARKVAMFPQVKFIKVEEVLYDDKIVEVDRANALLTVRRCAPTHFQDGRKVYDDPKVGNETLYKGELLDNDRMLGNKEELLAAKVVAVTKWFLTKSGSLAHQTNTLASMDIVKACNLTLSTLTPQTFRDLVNYAPTETGGEILHRIPNIRFSTATYIRSEMNRSLKYTTDLNQRLMTTLGLVDSNVNVDYLRMRFLVAATLRDKYPPVSRLVSRYGFANLIGIEDVQFVKPQPTQYSVTKTFRCYGDLRGHILSHLRFRYLAQSYMYEENMNEWALMPTYEEGRTAVELGEIFINDVILRYARDLDKDYMLIHPSVISEDTWGPLIKKLDSIDRSWRGYAGRPPLEEIRDRLTHSLYERGRMTLLSPKDTVVLALQTQCFRNLEDCRPVDDSMKLLSQQYSVMARTRRSSGLLNSKLAKYQAILLDFESHRAELAMYLIAEYVLTFHFKVRKINSIIEFSTGDSLQEFLDTGIGSLSHMLIAPDLQFQLLVLGIDYVRTIADTNLARISDLLSDVGADTSLADIEMPGSLPSIAATTILSGDEEIPDHLLDINYLLLPLPLGAMATMTEILPLAKFAHRCSTSGASPQAFTSHTGSDSLGAQVGLFQTLLHNDFVDGETRICDLTAGRGDGLYALRYLGLDCTSYTRTDTFTRLNYHPQILFHEPYDIFRGDTIKFVTDFDHVHVDVSFPGTSDQNLRDLIFMLEEHNLQYSIRVNSVKLDGYRREYTQGLPPYDHFLAYAGNATLKPYQIYLIGRPSQGRKVWEEIPLRNTMAFRAMALSFARLLSPATYSDRLMEYEPNSVSINLPKGIELTRFVETLTDRAIVEERKYYLRRYLLEVDEGAVIAIVRGKCDHQTQGLLRRAERSFYVSQGLPYGSLTYDKIGNVSYSSREYHEKHIDALSDPASEILETRLLGCDPEILEHFRVRHPVAEVRTWCNIALGLRDFCIMEFNSGHAAIMGLHSILQNSDGPKLSLHQREILLAIKLLVLAANRDSFIYGVDFCKGLALRKPAGNHSMNRVLRIYRLASYLFEDFQMLMRRGRIDIRSIRAIENSLEVRERMKYKYARASAPPRLPEFDPELSEQILGPHIEQIFEGFEKYTQALVELGKDEQTPSTLGEVLAKAELVFDIGISQQVDKAIERLGLVASGPHGFIDLGDDNIDYDEDW
jgi:hypothetical protein